MWRFQLATLASMLFASVNSSPLRTSAMNA
jgi:hypothetical protein